MNQISTASSIKSNNCTHFNNTKTPLFHNNFIQQILCLYVFIQDFYMNFLVNIIKTLANFYNCIIIHLYELENRKWKEKFE